MAAVSKIDLLFIIIIYIMTFYIYIYTLIKRQGGLGLDIRLVRSLATVKS